MQASDYPVISVNACPWNMAGWFHEKSDNVLDYLSDLCDNISKLKKGEEVDFDFIESLLTWSINDALKLVEMSTGSEQLYCHKNVEYIFENGHAGYRKLMKDFGMPHQIDIHEEAKQEQERERTERWRTHLQPYITGDRSNATKVHEMLNLIEKLTSLEEQLAKDLQKVTMHGEYEWEWFVEKYGAKT
ncbi:MAG: hypothetical protein FWE40_06320 [Oscillospiraceae bacterium]|jgi:hypothetical protein|nr:hypothetical protein [Oscillospiraceae bacterium]